MRRTIYLDERLHARLRRIVPPGGMNRFVHQVLAEKIEALEREQYRAMKEGYLATRADRAELNQEWATVDTEGWPA